MGGIRTPRTGIGLMLRVQHFPKVAKFQKYGFTFAWMIGIDCYSAKIGLGLPDRTFYQRFPNDSSIQVLFFCSYLYDFTSSFWRIADLIAENINHKMWGKYRPLSAFYLYMLWKSSTFHSEVQIKMKINKNAPWNYWNVVY